VADREMDLEAFKILYKRFSKLPLPKEVWETPEFEEYQNAIVASEECNNWYLAQNLKKKKLDFSTFCCLTMATHVSEGIGKRGKTIYDNVDVIIRKWEDGTFGIPIHDGGTSVITISYCPWCGLKLTQ
jgi:hypothetical protein